MSSLIRPAALFLMIGLFACSLLFGCASLTENNTDARLLTMYATIKIADGDQARAEVIEEVASDVQRYASSERHLTVDLLVGAIRDRVPWSDLDAADELLIHELLDRLRVELTDRLGADVLPEDLRLAADVVAGWVIQAAGRIG